MYEYGYRRVWPALHCSHHTVAVPLLIFVLFPGEHVGDRAQVGGTEGASLEAAHEEPACALAASRPDPGPGVGCGPGQERDGSEGRDTGGSGGDGT